ncbi:hypothetical protein SAMN05660772_01504 [Pasteurella testudinis DSM 23072]|uniref:Uncharacterized protein n=1 Tax=Pasteurella testudinis DSM 23072 TaxID=1122938 RepID=A0A1W1VA33_9PAST|nr:hypothetical protein SAMN05660772_01504 [Pasteurella testudinis DSM 23072]SUB51374.1 Uncharacterised protein [Pasteurella testudinis]
MFIITRLNRFYILFNYIIIKVKNRVLVYFRSFMKSNSFENPRSSFKASRLVR